VRYMVTVNMREDAGPPPPELVEAMGAAMGEAFASGTMLDAGGLAPTAESSRVRLAEGSISITDGPFTEAKEVVGGYSVIEVRSHAEAVENARRMIQIHHDHWPGWQGWADVRRISGAEEGPPSAG
jgi:hypothetical protein